MGDHTHTLTVLTEAEVECIGDGDRMSSLMQRVSEDVLKAFARSVVDHGLKVVGEHAAHSKFTDLPPSDLHKN